MGLPMIVGSMATTAAKPDGAGVLTKMMAQAGGSSPLDNLSGFLGGSQAAAGPAMINTLFGNQLAPVQNAIAQKTGLPPETVGKVLAIAAPMVLAYLGKMMGGKKTDTAGLTGLLGEQSAAALARSPDAAALMQQLMAAQPEAGSGGIAGMFKKMLGK
ncbi:DUF937 domain-containing protein [Methanoregula sp. PtaB.Bin085]|uniref:DUF937 domain-containing protein n=1 Tax=Methanoregula sp. PtaB.Bin085 TaxID=1811680 RepID=UPI0025FDF8FF|nr:DUF937 domain-containing protein [Methanoregula sp. PtaB.Bin085]